MKKSFQHLNTFNSTRCPRKLRELVVPNSTGQDTVIKLKDKQYAMTLVGGDQRIGGSQKIRGNSDTSEERLDGLLPVAEDWHAKVCYMEVRVMTSVLLNELDVC